MEGTGTCPRCGVVDVTRDLRAALADTSEADQ